MGKIFLIFSFGCIPVTKPLVLEDEFLLYLHHCRSSSVVVPQLRDPKLIVSVHRDNLLILD